MLNQLSIHFIAEWSIPLFTGILPYIKGTVKALILSVVPTSENFHSFTWKVLDVILSAWCIKIHRMCRSFSLWLSLLHPLRPGTAEDGSFSWSNRTREQLRILFPLTTSLGRGTWYQEDED